jgi:hypothetical protein
MSDTDMLTAGLSYLKAGLSLLPIATDGTKAPEGRVLPVDAQQNRTWKPYQVAPPTPDDLRRWCRQANQVGLAIIGGAVSGHLEILDFDAPEIFLPWCDMVEELAPGLVVRLPVVRTPGGGRHVYYRCQTIAGNQKLAARLDAEGKPETLIETRGEGGYVVAPPSPAACHALGKPYELMDGDLHDIPTISPEERTILLHAAQSFNAYVAPERTVSPEGSAAASLNGDRPGDAYNASMAWADILAPHGWTCVRRRGDILLWKRPGKQARGCSATTGCGKDLLYVFSTNAAPFASETSYSKFAAYAILDHRGDFGAAAKALAAHGYGQPASTYRRQGASVHAETNGHLSPPTPEDPMDVCRLEQTFQRWLHLRDPGPLRFVCATIAANRMESDPLWGMLVGGPGWGKTELLNSTGRLPHVHTAATITEAALLSGTRRKEKAPEAKGGLLRQIGPFGLLVLKDFTSILSMNRDVRAALLAALREIYDGSWTRHVGVDGGRELSWSGKLAIIAGCTGAIDSFHAVIGAMGERFVFYRFEHADGDEALQAHKALELVGKERQLRQELADAMARFFAGLTIPTSPPALDKPDRERLIALARLAARCRSAVERDGRTREIELIPDAEAPGRLALTLARLWAGLQCIGVAHDAAWTLLVKVAMDCMPDLRRQVFMYLLGHEGVRPSASDIALRLGYPTTTATRCLEDMAAHGVVIRHVSGRGKSHEWEMSDWAFALYQHVTNTP